MGLVSVGNPLLWAGFLAIIFLLLALDLFVFHRKAHEIHIREALLWSAFWIALSLLFNGWVFVRFSSKEGWEFLTAYLLEKALSVDNLFVFMLLFAHFAVPAKVQHRVLYWGILGALITRGTFIIAGTALVQMFHWILYLFGAFLVFTGLKIVFKKGGEAEEIHENAIVRFVRRLVRMTDQYDESKFFVRKEGLLYATPLLVVLVAVETTDVAFAVDSIPAVFGISRDPFIVFTSNIFAILGLRALYFAVAGVMKKFRFLGPALGIVLAFIGVKMLTEPWVNPWAAGRFGARADVVLAIGSLGVIVLLITSSMILSILFKEKTEPAVDRTAVDSATNKR